MRTINESIISRYKLLIEYDTSKTLDENLSLITEINPAILNNISKPVVDDVIKNVVGGIKTNAGKTISNADDLIRALRNNSIIVKDIGKIRSGLMKSPNLPLADKVGLIDDFVKNPRVYEKYKNLNQQQIVDKFKSAKYPDDVAEEIAAKLKSTSSINQNLGKVNIRLNSSQKSEYNKILNKWRQKQGGGNQNPGQGTRDRMIRHIENGGTADNFKLTKGGEPLIPKKTKTPKQGDKSKFDKTKVRVGQNWNWKSWVAWAATAGIGVGVLWWLFFSDDDDTYMPFDIPKEQPDDAEGNNEEGVYTTPGDPYQYKVIECVWHTKGGPNKIKEWKSLAGNDNANAILDKRHPQAKQGCTPKPTEETPPAPSPTTEPAPEIAREPSYINPNDVDRPQIQPVQPLPLKKSYVTP